VERIREYLKLAGKGDAKVAAVFCASPARALVAARHLQKGAPGLPLWLFTTRAPAAETASAFSRVIVEQDPLALLVRAQHELWPYRVALSVAAWTGEAGGWAAKLAPLLVPPFRVLVMNEHGGFFNAAPAAVARHIARRWRDAAHSAWHRMLDIGRGLWLWIFAAVAQWFSPLSRFAFAQGHGSQPLRLGMPAPEGEGVAVFRYGHRRWNLEELTRLVQTSTARWILFLEGREAPSIEHWLSLFDDRRTFAVSLQTTYRGWNPALFPVAPFRPLQPGEASRTLAPVSPVMLVDRIRLRALGIPRTVVPGTAWYLLFWQAAAAGWHSYSVGGGELGRETSDWPYEEAEFVTRALSDAAWKRLGPREPELARGNIGFALPPRRAAGDKPAVLVVSPYLPYPLSHGGAVRVYNLCRALAPRVDFLLAAFREQRDAIDYGKLYEVFREVYVVDLDERAARDPSLPRQVREHVSTSMAALLETLRPRVRLTQIEYTHLAHFRKAAGPRALLVEHDLTFTLYEQLNQSEEAARWRRLERACFQEFAGIWTMSDHDRERALAESAAPDRTFVVPNGVDTARFTPASAAAEAPEVFYVGSFRHLPNVLGFKKLRHEVMPHIWKRFPQAVLRVVAGPDPQRYHSVRESDPRVLIHGFVEDLRPLYACASVVAVPLLVSAGTNIKVMEAMACGKAVVTTSIGCVGLDLEDGYDALIRDDSAAFAEAVIELLSDPARRQALGAAARATAERRFSWEAVAQAALASYEALW
jgi:glycosyltransferase involved in cell wall biosynthesis